MIYKEREQPFQISLMQAMKKRLYLSEKDNQKLLKAIKGFEGECYFDSLTRNITSDCLILNDLLLEINDSVFQIDSLIITGEGITVYEVKNYEGNYVYEEGALKRMHNPLLFLNPSDQLKKTLILFKQWLSLERYNFNVKGYLVFVNDHFSLFQAPINKGVLHNYQA